LFLNRGLVESVKPMSALGVSGIRREASIGEFGCSANVKTL
jgi:hypothetical protein